MIRISDIRFLLSIITWQIIFYHSVGLICYVIILKCNYGIYVGGMFVIRMMIFLIFDRLFLHLYTRVYQEDIFRNDETISFHLQVQ